MTGNYSIVISDISITMDEDFIKRELMKKYNGVENVSRWYFDGDEDYPMQCVQVNFNSHENMNKVFDQGNIVINGICHRVSIVKGRPCYRCQKIGHQTYECDRKSLNQEDLFNMFAEQNR